MGGEASLALSGATGPPGAFGGVVSRVLGAPGQTGTAFGVDRGQDEPAEQADVLEEVAALAIALRRVLLLAEPVAGQGVGTRLAARSIEESRGNRPSASRDPARSWTAALSFTSVSGSWGRCGILAAIDGPTRIGRGFLGLGVAQRFHPSQTKTEASIGQARRRAAVIGRVLPASVRRKPIVHGRAPGRLGATCGRYAASRSPDDLVEEFEAAPSTSSRRCRRATTSPTDPVYAVMERTPRDEPEAAPQRQLRTVRWGLVPSWAKDPKIGPG